MSLVIRWIHKQWSRWPRFWCSRDSLRKLKKIMPCDAEANPRLCLVLYPFLFTVLKLRILVQIRELQSKMAETKENQRKQSADNSRVAKIFENQTRLRENIKSMEHVRTGSLLERLHEWHGQGREWLDSNATTHRAIRRATCQAEQWCVQAGFADCHENQSSSEKGKVLSWRSFLQDGHRQKLCSFVVNSFLSQICIEDIEDIRGSWFHLISVRVTPALYSLLGTRGKSERFDTCIFLCDCA